MKVAIVLLSVALVLTGTYIVGAEILSFPPLPDDECGGQHTDGLTGIINGFSDSFPTYEFLGIFLEAVSEDEEVAKVTSLLTTEEFDRLVYKVSEIDEWNELTDYICEDLQFNINFYLKVFGELFKVIPVDLNATMSTSRSRPGVSGLVEDIIEILPLNEWETKFKLVETNENVQKAIATVQGESFNMIIHSIMEMEEFKILSQNLRNLGLPVDCNISKLEKLLGWSYDLCACEKLSKECL